MYICIVTCYSQKTAKWPSGGKKRKNIQLNGSIGFFTLTAIVYFYLFLTSGNGKQPEMKLYHKAELQKTIHVPTVV